MNIFGVALSDEAMDYFKNLQKALLLQSGNDKILTLHQLEAIQTPQAIARLATRTSRSYDLVLISLTGLNRFPLETLGYFTNSCALPYVVVADHVPLRPSEWQQMYLDALFVRATEIWTLQSATKDLLTHVYHLPNEKITELGYGFWPRTEVPHSDDTNHSVAFFADSITIQGLDKWIRALPRLHKSNANLGFHIYVAADAPSEWVIRNRMWCHQLGLDDRVSWIEVEKEWSLEELPDYDLYVFSWHQTNGGDRYARFALMARGGTVITYQDAFYQECLSDLRTFSVQENDESRLPECLLRFYSDRKEQKMMKETSRLMEPAQTWNSLAARVALRMNQVVLTRSNNPLSALNLYVLPEYHARYAQSHFRSFQRAGVDRDLMLYWMAATLTRCNSPEVRAVVLQEMEEALEQDIHSVRLMPVWKELLNKNHFPQLQNALRYRIQESVEQLNHSANGKLNSADLSAFVATGWDRMSDISRKWVRQNTSMWMRDFHEKLQLEGFWWRKSLSVEDLERLVALFQAAQFLKDSNMHDIAERALYQIEQEVFVFHLFKPLVVVDRMSNLSHVAFLLVKCFRLKYAQNRKPDTLQRLIQIHGWFMGFNEKQKMVWNVQTGGCSNLWKDLGAPASDDAVWTIYFWLTQLELERAALILPLEQGN